MNNIVSRQELWHPLSIHLPIAFLLLATVINFILLFIRKEEWYNYLTISVLFLLCSGTLLLWLAFYTGNLAYGPVVRTICFPSILKKHLYWAYITCYSFSGVAGLFLLAFWFKLLNKKFIAGLLSVLLLLSSIFLSYTGHLGANLVYKYGAGVNPKAKDCDSFK